MLWLQSKRLLLSWHNCASNWLLTWRLSPKLVLQLLKHALVLKLLVMQLRKVRQLLPSPLLRQLNSRKMWAMRLQQLRHLPLPLKRIVKLLRQLKQLWPALRKKRTLRQLLRMQHGIQLKALLLKPLLQRTRHLFFRLLLPNRKLQLVILLMRLLLLPQPLH